MSKIVRIWVDLRFWLDVCCTTGQVLGDRQFWYEIGLLLAGTVIGYLIGGAS